MSSSGLCGPPKFGAASPQSVKKILSLSEQNKTRPHQPRHPGLGAPHVGAGGPGPFGAPSVGGPNIMGVPHHHGIPPHHMYSPSVSVHSPLSHHNLGSSVGGIQHSIRPTASPSPLSSPGAHRRIGSSSSAG